MQKEAHHTTVTRFNFTRLKSWTYLRNPFKSATNVIINTSVSEALQQDMYQIGGDIYKVLENERKAKQKLTNQQG